MAEQKMDLEKVDWDNLSYSEKLAFKVTTPADCSFVIGEGDCAKTIKAHRSVLARACTVFESMFSGNYKEANASFNIPLPNVFDFIDFKAILEYIYYKKTECLEFLSLKRLKHVAYLADYYSLDNLKNECHIKIERIIAERHTKFHDFLQIFEYEKKLGRTITSFQYKGTSYDYANISTNFPYESAQLLKNTSIYDLEPLYFYELLKVLASKFKEIERFCLIENYAKIHRLKLEDFALNDSQEISKSVGVGESETPMARKTLKEMFDLIDFRKMTASQFEYGPANSQIWNVSVEEKFQISHCVKKRSRLQKKEKVNTFSNAQNLNHADRRLRSKYAEQLNSNGIGKRSSDSDESDYFY